MKINVVVVRGVNDDEVVELAGFGRERGVEVRYIEFMPLDADGGWAREQVVGADEIVGAIAERWPLEPVVRGHEPAQRWRYVDGQGSIGVIPSVTDAFCGSCDRVRLTADGNLRSCLFAVDETDLRGPIRDGASDDELAALITSTVAAKWAGHGIASVDFSRPGARCPRSAAERGSGNRGRGRDVRTTCAVASSPSCSCRSSCSPPAATTDDDTATSDDPTSERAADPGDTEPVDPGDGAGPVDADAGPARPAPTAVDSVAVVDGEMATSWRCPSTTASGSATALTGWRWWRPTSP